MPICYHQVQLPSYNWTKNHLISNGILPADSVWTFLASSSVSGMCVVCIVSPDFTPSLLRSPQLAAMQPADTVSYPCHSLFLSLIPLARR